jgi:hypothetical protein
MSSAAPLATLAALSACLFRLPRSFRVSLMATLLASALAATAPLHAQQLTLNSSPDLPSSADPTSLPAAPAPQTAATPAASQEPVEQQPKRILGIIPNFRAVSTTEKLPPQSVKEKFVTATEDSFDYSSLFFPVVIAGYNQLRKADPEFGTGGVAFGRYFWHAAVDQTVENYMVEFVGPSLTHEDSRYYTLGHGGFWKRAGYSLSRAVVTRSDQAKPVFNFSEIFGAGAAAGISNLYYPSRERTLGNTADQWALDVGIDAGVFMFKEFWPDIHKRVFHHATPAPSAP